ncbi:MAG: dethiobiotin synthase [Flectobacillus sp.]|nr:dethiobiotin synthase [Flectobacillus sp.]
MASNQFIVAGIGTEIGKTFISSILVEALEANYWKPIQSGGLDYTDTDTVKGLVTNQKSVFYPEAYRLTQPLSPHAAAEIDGVTIEVEDFQLPQTTAPLVVELAGGLMVPLNNDVLNIDLIEKFNLPVVLVTRNYLGSINHTLLSVHLLQSRGIAIKGLIFNGLSNPATESFILNHTKLPLLAKVEEHSEITPSLVSHYATVFKSIFCN